MKLLGVGIPTPPLGKLGTIAVQDPGVCGDLTLMTGQAPGSAIWPVANRAYFFVFEVSSPIIVTQAWTYNGTVVSGNIDMGVYSLTGTLLVSSGTTVHAGLSVLQSVGLTDTALPPGLYWMALAVNNITATFFRWSTAAIQWQIPVGVQQMATAFPLPATATFANPTTTFVPCFGLSFRSVI